MVCKEHLEELRAEAVQEAKEEAMYEWIKHNKHPLIQDYLEVMADDFMQYCKEAYWQDVDRN